MGSGIKLSHNQQKQIYAKKYSETIYYFFIVLNCDPNFGIGDFVAGATPVSLVVPTFISHG